MTHNLFHNKKSKRRERERELKHGINTLVSDCVHKEIAYVIKTNLTLLLF